VVPCLNACVQVDVLAPVVSSPIMSPTGYVMVGTQGGKLFALYYETGEYNSVTSTTVTAQMSTCPVEGRT
jgi:hypothetical protein